MLDKVIKFLPAWQRGMLVRFGRLISIKAVIMATLFHQLLLVVEVSVWFLKEIRKWIQGFFCDGKDEANRGQFLVAWKNICKPTCFGGLGVKNLGLFIWSG
jgi:hypothetical protein